jgi:hypothetical protein
MMCQTEASIQENANVFEPKTLKIAKQGNTLKMVIPLPLDNLMPQFALP